MQKRWPTNLVAMVAALGVIAALVYAFLPAPVPVEVRAVTRGDLQVTVDEDGRTRIKEKYVVSSPLAGRLTRVQLHPGDEVRAGETVLTTLDPTSPTLLDARTRAEAEARLKAAEAARKRADTTVEQSRIAEQFAQEEYDRAKKIFERNGVSHEDLDRAELRLRSAQESFKASQFAVQIAEHELTLARAAMIHTQRNGADDATDADAWRLEIRSPITGRVLRVFQESAAVVSPGTPLMELGDPTDLEVVVDVLSSDAVKISPGNEVRLEDWGGTEPLVARVRLVEPSGYTKNSALGVEEQRVNVIIDLAAPAAQRLKLGDDFRVEARIVIAHEKNVLKIPNGALFRHGDESAVFVIHQGRATLRPVTTTRRNRLESEVTAGLHEADQVIVYPSDKVQDGVAVQVRRMDA